MLLPPRGLEISIDALFYDLKPGEQRILQGLRKLWKQKVYLSALRLADGELLIVATDHLMESPIQHYSLRRESGDIYRRQSKSKKHGRKAISYFRYGLDLLRDIVLNGGRCIQHGLTDILRCLSIIPTTCSVL